MKYYLLQVRTGGALSVFKVPDTIISNQLKFGLFASIEQPITCCYGITFRGITSAEKSLCTLFLTILDDMLIIYHRYFRFNSDLLS